MQLDNDQAIATAANVALDSIGGAWHRVLTDLKPPDSKDALLILFAVAGTERFKIETRLSAALYALTIDPSKSRSSLAIQSIIPLITKALESTGAPDQQIRAANTARLLGSTARDTLPALRRCLPSLPAGIAALGENDRFSKTIRSAITAIEADISAHER
jgi:hypothetical protein